MAAIDEPTMTFMTFVDEAYGEYTSLMSDGERSARTYAKDFLGDKLPLHGAELVTKGIPSTDKAGGILREAHSLVSLRQAPYDGDTRYVTQNPDGDIILASALIAGGPLGKTMDEILPSEESPDLVASIQRVASRTQRGGDTTRIPNIIHSKGLARHTGSILSPSALLAAIMSGTDKLEGLRVAEIHPGFGELMLTSVLTDTITYRGLETDSELLPGQYEPKAGSIPARDDLRGVLDVVVPPADAERVLLTNDPDELGEDPYDVVVVRQPRDDGDIATATKLIAPDGILVVIPGENARSPGGLVAAIVPGPVPGMSNPEMIGIQTLAQEFVGALVYRSSGDDTAAAESTEPDARRTPSVSFDKVNGVPFINAGKDRLPAIVLTARAVADVGVECVVLRAPRHIIKSSVASIATKMTGTHVYLVETHEEVSLLAKWLKTKGIRVMTETELAASSSLANMVRTITNSILTSRNKSKRGKYSRPNTIVTYGTCPMMLTAVADAFPEATITVVIPPRETLVHQSLDALVRRGYGKIRIIQVSPDQSPTGAITEAIKSSGSSVVWNTSWGRHRT
jgi:hypothetical protein